MEKDCQVQLTEQRNGAVRVDTHHILSCVVLPFGVCYRCFIVPNTVQSQQNYQ